MNDPKAFSSEAEEATYWLEHPDEFEEAVADEPGFRVGEVFPDLAPSTERVNIRIPAFLLARIKQSASQRDMPYQSFIKAVLFDAFFPRLAISPPTGTQEAPPRARLVKRKDAAAEEGIHAQHVVPHERGWAVRGAGNARATSVHSTQGEAIKAARAIAKNKKTDLVIHDTRGRVRERDSYAD